MSTSDTFHDAAFWRALFAAEAIAVIGARKTPATWGYDALRAVIEATRINGDCKVYAVNPNEKDILGVPTFKSILDIPGEVELAVIVVPSQAVPGVFRQCAEKKVKAAVIISAGFGEVDGQGKELESEIVAVSREAGIPFIGPNCLGHADVHTRVASAGIANLIAPGAIAMVSQSGTLAASILQNAGRRGLGMSKFISTGNEATTRLEDCLEYLKQDKATKIIALYIEGLREARRFYELAKEITAHKPIIAMKAGGTGKAARAAHSHTGALSGSDVIYDAAFKQSGVIRVEDEDELADVALSLQNMPLPAGKRIAILTMGGGFGVVTAEVCEREGLEIADLEQATLDKLATIFPPRWNPGNPVDMVGVRPFGEDRTIMQCYRSLMADPNVDAVFSLLPPMAWTAQPGLELKPEQLEAMKQRSRESLVELQDLIRQHRKPVSFITRITFTEAGKGALPRKDAITEFPHPRRAARVMRYLARYQKYLKDRGIKRENR